MRCARHGVKCVEPPGVVVQPKTGARYVVRELLGEGGFARVFRVDSGEGRGRGESGFLGGGVSSSTITSGESDVEEVAFALKVISKCRLGGGGEGRDVLRNEVRIHRALLHPAVVKLHSYWEDPYRIYLLMHLVDGPCLAELVRTRGRLCESDARRFAANLLEALSYLHANRIIHRDVKLANLLCTRDLKRVLLCDFGLAATVDSLKKGAAVCGTPTYVAPELLKPRLMRRNPLAYPTGAAKLQEPLVGHSTSSDAWSAGVVLYTMLVGWGPFDSDDVGRTFRRIRAARFTFPTGLRISSAAKGLIRSLLSENHATRPTIDQALQHPFFHARPSSPMVGAGLSPNDCHSLENRPDIREDRPRTADRFAGPGAASSRMDRWDDRRGNAMSSSRLRNMGSSSTGCPRSHDFRRWSGSHQSQAGRSSSDVGLVAGSSDSSFQGSTTNSASVGHISEPLNILQPLSAAAERRSSLRYGGSLAPSTRSVRRSSLGHEESGKVRDENAYPARGSSRRVASMLSAKNSRFINLSLVVSAAMLKGRKLLDDDGEGASSSWRFDAVATQISTESAPTGLVRRWLDYTSKYGFATLMQDGRAGCCFNDGSILFYVSDATEIPDVAYVPPPDRVMDNNAARKRSSLRKGQSQADLSKKAHLCALFAEMMLDGGRGSMYELPSACNVSFLGDGDQTDGSSFALPRSAHGDDCKLVHVREWQRYRNPYKAAAFRLSNNCIQVKMDVGEEHCDDFLFNATTATLFYRDSRGSCWECSLDDLAEFSTRSERLFKQLELCRYAIARFLG